MKRSLAIVVTLLASSLYSVAQTQVERDSAVKYLEETRAKVQEATKGLSEAQLNFKPAPDRWRKWRNISLPRKICSTA